MSMDKMINIVLGVLIFASLGGTIATAVTDSSGNFSGASAILWGLTTLVVVIIFIKGLLKKS